MYLFMSIFFLFSSFQTQLQVPWRTSRKLLTHNPLSLQDGDRYMNLMFFSTIAGKHYWLKFLSKEKNQQAVNLCIF